MGVLIVKQVIYVGDMYHYESPLLHEGLNVVYGDNGSGKSTFSYFIEYALGGKVQPFNRDQVMEKYKLIVEDTNNFVQLYISISGENYSLKRYLHENNIFIEQNEKVSKLAIYRRGEPQIFSDWILEKLGIPNFQMNLGTDHWRFGFSDLFRLLNYDQDTEDKKIYKAPPADNFITESIIVRKAIFEVLLGLSSAEYFRKLDELKTSLKKRDEAKAIMDGFTQRYPQSQDDNTRLNADKKDKETELNHLYLRRNDYLKTNTNVPAKFNQVSDIQQRLVTTELNLSSERLKLSNLVTERDKVALLYADSQNEISQLKKIIFTHNKLDLFKMELCPFCATEIPNVQEGYCICGSKFGEDDYEKFVYSAGEYKDILTHKEKGIEAIRIATESFDQRIRELSASLENNLKLSQELRSQLQEIIMNSEFSGNSDLIEELNKTIIKLKDELFSIEKKLSISNEYASLASDFATKHKEYVKLHKVFTIIKAQFEKNNADTIKNFNAIYSELLSKSSLQSKHAELNDDYMPLVDHGEYHQASAAVPRRLMYYFTILSMALKYPNVKHPKFLLIDTPENSGIDRELLQSDILLLKDAVALSKRNPDDKIPEFQVILTIGYGRLPQEFEDSVLEKFNKAEKIFILKESKAPETPIETVEEPAS